MRRAAGQAGRVLHRACGILFTATILLGLGLGAAAWRLAQGPVELPFLAQQIEAAFNEAGGPTRLEIGNAIIAWQGWEQGRALPLELTLRGVRAVEAGGAVRAELPDAAVSLSPRALLQGRLVPRSLVLRGPRLRAFRAADGAFAFDLGSLGEDSEAAAAPAERQAGEDFLGHLLSELQRPPSDRSALSALRRVAVHGGRLAVVDQQLGRAWAMEGVEIELVRLARGGLELSGSAVLTLDQERVPVRLAGSLGAGLQRAELTLSLPAVRPAALARAAPALAPLAMLDASAAVTATARFDAAGRPVALAGQLVTGAGSLAVARGKVAIAGLELRADYAEAALRLERARLRLAPPPGAGQAPAPILTAQGEARLAGGVWRAALELGVDRVDFADLAHYWPEGIGGNARRWMTANLTAGVAQNGRWRVELQATEALEGFTLVDLAGSAEASGATVHWLRPMAPVEGVSGRAEFNPTAITIRAQGGRQSGTALELREGTLKVSFETDPEIADFNLRLAGPLGDAWTLVRHPRLHLFDRRPPPVGEMSGTLQEVRIALTFRMVDALPAEEVRIRAQLRAADVRIPRAVLDRDLERGAIEATLDNDGLRATGQAVVAEIPLRLTQEMDFRPGPATQVLTRESATARAELRQLAALGFDLSAVAEGTMGLELRNETRRSGRGRLTVKADLRDTRLALDPLAWSKARGTAGSAEFALRLQNGVLAAVESARIEAPDALLRGRAEAMRQGMPERLEIQESQLGRSRFSGELRPPASQGAPWSLALRGPLLDLAPAMAAQDNPTVETPPAAAAQRGPSVALDARFDRVVLGEGRQMTAVTTQARVDGAGVVQQVAARGRLTANAGFELSLLPQGRRRELRIASEDGGALLRAFDLVGSIQGGRLSVLAHYDSQLPGATLAGTAELNDFSVRNAPALGKLLQAMTLYGLVDALSGPGLGFTRLIAPFRLTRQALTIEDARAFSSSLGLTAKGHLDRRRSILDMEGTIVPAYFINSLLGHIPLLGRIFSPEAGGGVFAATYRVRGALNDPNVTVNPLAALTPGFLRGLFGPLEASREPMQVPGQR